MNWIRANIWRPVALALGGIALALLVQIHGLPIIGGGLIARLDRMTELRRVEADNHRTTKRNYAQAMADARRNEALRLARVKAEQERINVRAQETANARLAGLRADYDRLRNQARTGVGSARGNQPVPDLPTPAFDPDAAARANGLSATELSLAERYQCSVSATQLDELISWVEAQVAVRVND